MEKEIILEGFYPLSILGRLLGYFAFTNVGQVNSSSELRIKLLSINLLVTALFTLTINASYIISLSDIKNAIEISSDDSVSFTQSIIYTLVIFYQIFGMSMIVHANVKTKAFIDFLRHWNSVQSLLRCRKFLKIFGYFITFGVLILSLIYTIFRYTYFARPVTIVKVFKTISLVMSTSVCLYFGGFIVYFTKALQCCFAALEQDLKDCLVSESHLKTKLSSIRHRHELLISLSHRFNSLLSPILICYLIIESCSSCVSTYESMELLLVQHSQDMLKVVRPAVIGTIKFIPIIAICLSGEMITQQASSLIRQLASHPLHQLTIDSNFQLEMLRFQFQNRIPCISADGFLKVNNRLLGEILGVIATYIVVMLEVSQGRSS